MKTVLLLIVTFAIGQNKGMGHYIKHDRRPPLTTANIIRQEGYHAETHTVITEDGYILTLDRIFANKKGVPGKQPVFLQHGIFDTSYVWINNVDTSLAFLLSDENFDVWLGNSRGNTYSSTHLKYSPLSPQYWNFSFHEMGVYDLSACVRYILNITNATDGIHYVGHSQGGSVFYVYASTFPEIAAKNIKIAFTLAPAVFLGHANQLTRLSAQFLMENRWLLNPSGVSHIPLSDMFQFLTHDCDVLLLATATCRTLIDNVIQPLFGHPDASVSIKNGIHYGQLFKTDKFQKYNYGPHGNLIIYGVRETPSYGLSKVKVPTYIYCGEIDKLVTSKDCKKLVKELPNNKYFKEVKHYNHNDFIYSKHIRKMVYNNIVEIFKSYRSSSLTQLQTPNLNGKKKT